MADPRPRQLLNELTKRYPAAWSMYETFLNGRQELGDWPEWCYVPVAAAYAIVSGVEPQVRLDKIGDVACLAAVASWRLTQGIYRFDPTLYDALISTPLNGDLPCSLLHRLPEWGLYIETPGFQYRGREVHGFFAHLESDARTKHEELRLVLDMDGLPELIPLHLGPGSLDDAIARAADYTARNLNLPKQDVLNAWEPLPAAATHLVSLLLYLCIDEPEISGNGTMRPRYPVPKKTKRGQRLFAAEKAMKWDVGVRMGAALRQAQAQAAAAARTGDTQNDRASPRAHIRRAHWHTYHAGVGRKEARLRWLPPIPVNLVGDVELPAVIHPVN